MGTGEVYNRADIQPLRDARHIGWGERSYVKPRVFRFLPSDSAVRKENIMPILIDPDLLDEFLQLYNPIIGTAASEALYGTGVRDRIDGKEGNDYL